MPTATRRDSVQVPGYPLYLLISPDHAARLRPPPPPPSDDAAEPEEAAEPGPLDGH